MLIGIALQFNSCGEKQVNNIGTIKTDDKPLGWWRPQSEQLVVDFTDSVGNEMRFTSPGLILEFKNQSDSYANSHGSYTGIFEYKTISYGSDNGKYTFIYTLEPHYSDEPMWDEDKIKVEFYDLNNELLINEIYETIDMNGLCSFSNKITLNNIEFDSVYSKYNSTLGTIHFKKHFGIIGFSHDDVLWVLKE